MFKTNIANLFEAMILKVAVNVSHIKIYLAIHELVVCCFLFVCFCCCFVYFLFVCLIVGEA